ncbi:hypothetical protein [Marinibactrum halimedae]|uniref:Uncharacterized protein n=1 Tax=Marinibactrum halimedae TaxID=1444977 RepID=A0AA37TCP9_9GAMM|nr:hypothetical protein [Marinibactrum halimedae]MCD9460226.1 hypothetical protein [Marinibactrum halimedae]GLS27941.1 hypothetical protein GCM10007877_36600 [Marinibactrum halimedae]
MSSKAQSVCFRNPFFDSFFVVILPVIAISSAVFVSINPSYFDLVLLLDLSLLGYHHVISTYTRLAGSWESNKLNKALTLYLPPFVLFVVFSLALIGSVWLIATVYLHWQWWHYTRQSEGIAKSIKYKSQSTESGPVLFHRLVFYITPITTFAYMSSLQPDAFLYMDVVTLPIPAEMVYGLAAINIILMIAWGCWLIWALYSQKVSLNYALYHLSHHAIFVVAYVAISNINYGWLAINIWHNFQYILFVWHFNTKTINNTVNSGNKLLFWLFKPSRWYLYFGVCLVATALFYGLVDAGISVLTVYTTLPLTVVVYMAINFHHYVVDTYIWKLRQPKIRSVIAASA